MSHVKSVVQNSNEPAALKLAELVVALQVQGNFDERTDTWSNRDFECASMKKHNEQM